MERTGYGRVSRWNHWLTAVIVLTLLVIGLYFHEMPRGDEKSYWRSLHISIGALAWLLVMFRMAWRLRHGFLPAVEQHIWLQRISKISHWLLLIGIIIMFISGPLTVWSIGRGIAVFDWFTIPSPLPRMPEFHEWLEEVHAATARVLMWLMGLHILAAIWHFIKHKAQIRGRMWG